MWMAFGGHSIRRRSRVTSESDLNSLWLLNETPFCGSVLGSVHSEYTHWPAAVQLGYDRLHFGNTFSANYFSNSESRHYGDELLLYNYTPPYDVYYFDSGSESQIRCPTPDYSPSESPSQECSRLSVDSLYGGTCRVNSGRADEVETDSGSSGYASSSLSQKWEHCPPPVNKCAHRKRCCCCSDCTHLNVASDQQQSQIDTRRSYSRQEPIPPIHSDERNSRVKAVTFSEPLSTDVHPSVESSSSANDGSFRRRATQILSPARKWLSLPLRIEHTSLIGQLPELQHRVKATLEAIMSHEISSELWKAARGSSSSSTPVKSGGVTVSNSVTVGGLLHSSSEVDVSSKRSSMMSAVFDGESSKTDVRKRPPLPPNPPSRYRILKYSNVSAQRVSGESSSVCSSSNDERVLEGKLQAQKGSRSGANGVSGAATTLQASGHQYPSLQNRTGITSMGAIPNVGGQLANLVSSTRSKKKSTKKDKKTRIRKEDISNPTNFLHKVHVGWDQDGGFSQETYDGEPMDESILTLLRAAGQNPDRMTKEDLDFSYRFITDYQKTTQSPVVPPPPPPLMQQNTQRSYHPSQAMQNATSPPPPPPPPIRREASLTSTPPSRPPQRPPAVSRPLARPLPTPPSLSSGSSYRPNDAPPPPPPPNFAAGDSSIPPPPPPPPPTIQTGGVAPPPPPPPPPIGPAPALPPPAAGGRANLLNEIHAGIALRPVSMNAQNDNNNVGSREDVMAQIRQGANLKPVDKAAIENRKSTPNIADVGGIAGALARALEERRRNMHNSDDSEEEEAENNDSEWETD